MVESKLKKRRLAYGYTQMELAKQTGINIKSLTNYEQDNSKLNKASVSTIVKLADCLGCTVEDLIDRSCL